MTKKLVQYGDELYGRLRVLSIASERGPKGIVMVNCICTCGALCTKRGADVRTLKVRSCGCLKKEFGQSDEQIWRKASLLEHGASALRIRDPWLVKSQGIHRRCKADGVDFGFKSGQHLAQYLLALNVTHCPIFGFELKHAEGHAKFDSYSVDRRDPSKGYTCENIQVISYLANTMKSNATTGQLRMFAKWILEQ